MASTNRPPFHTLQYHNFVDAMIQRKCKCGNFKALAAEVCGDCQGYKIRFTFKERKLIELAKREMREEGEMP